MASKSMPREILEPLLQDLGVPADRPGKIEIHWDGQSCYYRVPRVVGVRVRRQSTPHRRYTTSQAAEVMGVTEQTIRRWCEDGRLPARRTVGGHWRIEPEAIDRVGRFHTVTKALVGTEPITSAFEDEEEGDDGDKA